MGNFNFEFATTTTLLVGERWKGCAVKIVNPNEIHVCTLRRTYRTIPPLGTRKKTCLILLPWEAYKVWQIAVYQNGFRQSLAFFSQCSSTYNFQNCEKYKPGKKCLPQTLEGNQTTIIVRFIWKLVLLILDK